MSLITTKTQKINGEDVTLYYTNALANALGRTTQTIRKWEIAGFLPKPIFKDNFGRKLYSKEQIEVIVECAERSHVRQGYSIANTNFPPRVHKALNELNKKYFKKGE